MTAFGCAADPPSLASVRSSAEARVTGTPSRESDETAAKLLASPLTPDTAARVAILNSHAVQAAYARLGIAHGELVHALRVPNPRAEAAVRFRRSGSPDIEILATIGLSELAFLPLRSEAAQASLEAERLAAVAFIVDLAFDVREAFVAYQAAEQSLDLDRTVLAATQAAADAAAHLHEAGNLTDLDLANERAFAEEARVATRRAETARVEARARLSELMGLGSPADWTAATTRLPDPPAEELAVDHLEERALTQSLDLTMAKERATAADKRATAAQVEGLLPDLRAGVSARREGDWGVGPAASLEVPLFYQGQGLTEVARAERREEEELGATLSFSIRRAARTAADRLTAARENAVEYRDVLLPLRQRVLDQTELEYNGMAVGVFQLLVAKRDEVQTARAYVELLREYWTARAEVERLEAGRLSAAR
ncbi:MAG TPA: TolC family protein [Polyangiaceae bacterium]|nr:TolC family protein [Polyangiaceae bacterium]